MKLQTIVLNNLTLGRTSSKQLLPAGNYKNVYVFSNNEGFNLEIALSILNFSTDKQEF